MDKFEVIDLLINTMTDEEAIGHVIAGAFTAGLINEDEADALGETQGLLWITWLVSKRQLPDGPLC